MTRLLFCCVCSLVIIACQFPSVSVDTGDTEENRIDLHPCQGEACWILIDKSDYRLYVYADTQLVHSWPVVFGGNPVDDKLRQGDKCTPEGRFRVRSKRVHEKWARFIWIDYPTADSWKKHQTAKEAGLIAANAGIGGEIGIHGVPDGYDYAIDYRYNWTLGCISMKNQDVAALFPYIYNGMEVAIQP